MAVDKLNLQTFSALFMQHQSRIHWLVVAVLLLYLLALSADFIWRIIPEPQPSSQSFANSADKASLSRKNKVSRSSISALQALNLFGSAEVQNQEVAQQTVEDAPETRLNLVLNGTVASSDPSLGAAIIEHRGAQQTYGVGEKIEGTNASLRQVLEDRVILRNGVRDETLMLQGIDFDKANRERNQQIASTQQRRQKPVGPRLNDAALQSRKLSAEAVQATQQLRNSPNSFTDFISVRPFRQDSKTVGFTVSPGNNPALFNAVGLQTGDVITQINGIEVTSAEALNALRSAESLELTLNRQNEVITLYLELPQSEDI